MFNEFSNLTDKELIEEVKKALNVKDLQLLANELDIPRPTLAKWSSTGSISKNGTGRQYLMMILKYKKLENDLNSHINTHNKLFDTIDIFINDINDLRN